MPLPLCCLEARRWNERLFRVDSRMGKTEAFQLTNKAPPDVARTTTSTTHDPESGWGRCFDVC